MNHVIECFELPLPAIETYRQVKRPPMQSLDLEVAFDDGRGPEILAPPSDRFLRARCWASED